jgi:hypothetical protein
VNLALYDRNRHMIDGAHAPKTLGKVLDLKHHPDLMVEPFGSATSRFLRREKEAPLRVNPERSTELTPKSSPGL